ncbi:DUF998 domain-containing protein [Phenylobacterium sp.]|uniref:DUF998 domain-containing protein n=1 Tax=Phenylobacterium sp. TaxID=1871053 RepID=UPI001229B071|nr:DUF998 domain-containing protein [Phenylobacterium sp.]THD64971.1 MAG: DUF998 domain-containing protein [Phenylobacterium sp.]
MKRDVRLLFGPLTAVIFLVGVAGLAMTVPGYDSVRQTVSEIGEVGSPAQVPFSVMLWAVAATAIVFCLGLRRAALDARATPWPAYVAALMAVCSAGIAVFAFPHPLHNLFGLSELVPYQAPLILALTWRGRPALRGGVAFSAVMAAVVWLAILLNLTTLHRHGAVWTVIHPVYGLVQRGLFASFFVWFGGLGWMLWRRKAALPSAPRPVIQLFDE